MPIKMLLFSCIATWRGLGGLSCVVDANVTGLKTISGSSGSHTEPGLNVSLQLQFRLWLRCSTKLIRGASPSSMCLKNDMNIGNIYLLLCVAVLLSARFWPSSSFLPLHPASRRLHFALQLKGITCSSSNVLSAT